MIAPALRPLFTRVTDPMPSPRTPRNLPLPALLCAASLLTAATADAGLPAAQLYQLRCSGCHTPQGSGHPEQGVPDFRGKIGSFAGTEDGRIYLLHVPGVIGSSLSDRGIADVLNYVMRQWGGSSLPTPYRPFTAAEVARLKQVPIGDLVKYRRALAKTLAARSLPVASYPWP